MSRSVCDRTRLSIHDARWLPVTSLGLCLFLFSLASVAVGAMQVSEQVDESGSETIQTLAVPPPVTLSELPGYAAYQKIAALRGAVGKEGRVNRVQWSQDGKSLAITSDGNRKTVDLSSGEFRDFDDAEFLPSKPIPTEPKLRIPVASVGRAEQRLFAVSPDGKWKASYRDFNVSVDPFQAAVEPAEKTPATNDSDEGSGQDNQTEKAVPDKTADLADTDRKGFAVTTTGTEKLRYGTCCWVYGEELDQSDAMWWSPDSKKLAFYRVSESHMKDYFLSVKNAEVYPQLETTRYPTAGEANPHVALMIFDMVSMQTIQVRIAGPVDQYIYNIEFTPDSQALKFHRTNRWQNKLDVMLADATTGATRVVVSEEQATWQENSPLFRLLGDGQRFIWETERSGFRGLELRNLSGERLNALTESEHYPYGSIVELDEAAGWLYYTAFPETNPYHAQLFRVRLDGTERKKLTQETLNHTSFKISPDHQYFVCTYESAETAPETSLYNMDGKRIAVLATASGSLEAEHGLQAPELFQFLADDQKTQIYGVLYKPSHFDPAKKYPLVIDVYGGPQSSAFDNRYGAGNPACEFGFIIAKIGNRGTQGRSKAFESATYMALGTADLQDQADAVEHLSQRPYIDRSRVGIYGHSYGGYMTALALLKFPDVFHVGVSGAPVTHWKNYDTIYTERYMKTPQENPSGYQSGACETYAKNLKGRLLLVHGLMDDNVHPSNTWQLADALYKADKRFDMQIYPGYRHGIGSTYSQLRWEYLIRWLSPEAAMASEN